MNRKIIIGTIVIVIIYILANIFGCIDLYSIMDPVDNDVHFNILTVCSIIGGFLFTGLSILIGVSDKKIIREYMKTDIINSIYSNILSGIFFNIVSIILAILIILNVNVTYMPNLKSWLSHFEVLSLLLGLWCFVMSIVDLKFIIDSIKQTDNKISEEVMDRVRKKFKTNDKT